MPCMLQAVAIRPPISVALYFREQLTWRGRLVAGMSTETEHCRFASESRNERPRRRRRQSLRCCHRGALANWQRAARPGSREVQVSGVFAVVYEAAVGRSLKRMDSGD